MRYIVWFFKCLRLKTIFLRLPKRLFLVVCHELDNFRKIYKIIEDLRMVFKDLRMILLDLFQLISQLFQKNLQFS